MKLLYKIFLLIIFIYNFEYLMDKIIIITYPLLFLDEINNKRTEFLLFIKNKVYNI